MSFNNWFNTFIEEKAVNLDQIIEVEGESGANIMELRVVTDAIQTAPAHEQAQIKNTLVKIDFHNGDVVHFFKHLAGALAI